MRCALFRFWCFVSDLTPEIKLAIREAYAKLSTLPNFSTRRPQREMIALAAEAFASDGIAAIQAPTGTGKSIAALLPAIPIARANERTIVISTATISCIVTLSRRSHRCAPRPACEANQEPQRAIEAIARRAAQG